MHQRPVIAIVGRPNVGKSSFFNAVVGRRVSIVDPVAGVTRDRVSADITFQGTEFELIDTGGIGLFDETLLKDEVERQIAIALDLADVVIFLVDVREGRTPLDEEVAGRLRRCGCPVVLVANKADTAALEEYRHVFFRLGFGEPLAASAHEKRGVYAVLEQALELIPGEDAEDRFEEGAPARVKVAVVGRMNVGKSSLVNYLAQEERVIVSELPGTTRDSVDVTFEIGGRQYVVIDTAGMRRKTSIQDSIEFYGQARAERAIRRADVVVLMLDATREIAKVDKKIADMVITSYKPCVLAVSKWDLVQDSTSDDYEAYVAAKLRGFDFMPLTFISSQTGFNIEATFELVTELYHQASQRASTAMINKVLEDAVRRRTPQIRLAKPGKIYFGMQIETCPPTILVYVNDIKLFNHDYRRYLANRFRKALPYSEVPIKIAFRGKDRVGLPPPGRTIDS